MKSTILLYIMLLVSSSSFGKAFYTMTKDDFTNQFSVSRDLKRVYCYNENKDKVWLYVDDNSLLIIKLQSNKEVTLVLHTIQYNNGIIEALKQNSFYKKSTFSINDVTAITIPKCRCSHEQELPYFNMEESRNSVRLKNDSLKQRYLNRSEFEIYLKKKGSLHNDTIIIEENACYNMKFSDNSETIYGVVQKITKDSIYISNRFNRSMAMADKIEYQIYKYSIREILELSVMKSGGYSFKSIMVNDFNIFTEKTSRDKYPCWFSMNPRTGEIGFYRVWLTERGLIGIREKNSKITWYEGGITD